MGSRRSGSGTSRGRAPMRTSTSWEKNSTISDSVAMLRPGGTYYLVGYGGTVTLPTMQMVLGEITVAANLIGTYADLADLVTLADQGKVVLHSSRYPLE